MIQIFYWVLNMAIVGSLVGVFLILLRRIKRLPRNFIYVLYSIVLFRFLCPLGFANGFGFLNLLPNGTVLRVNPLTGSESKLNDYLLSSNFMQKAETYQPFVLKSDGWTVGYDIGSKIWIVVSVVLLFGYLLMYWIATRELNKATLNRGNIYQSNAINSPMVVGIFKPRIILPIGLSEEDDAFSYIIAHEKTHMKKHDNLWRVVAIALACIYWFNPITWILIKNFFDDMELACDETTIRSFTEAERKKYATALLSASQKETMICATAFAGGNVKIRIKCVLNYKQVTLLSVICLFLMFILFAICFLSN